MHATWPIAAPGASVPRPTVAPRVAPRVMKAADLLSFERQGYWLDRGLLDKAQVQALAPALDRVYDQQAHAVLRQKVRVVLGDDALSQAEASGSSLRAQTKVCAMQRDMTNVTGPLGHVHPNRGPHRLRRKARALQSTLSRSSAVGSSRRPTAQSLSSSSSTRGDTRRTCCSCSARRASPAPRRSC